MWRVLWLCVCLAAQSRGEADETPTVSISQGQLKGAFLTSRGGRRFSAFEGIPFASPPIGPLRFLSPQPAETWKEIRDATKPGSQCLHMQLLQKISLVGSEDCLYLNVYTHKASNESKVPVLVFIHGGGFVEGSGDIYRPDFLMDKDIVFVTLNYRLGPLGFISLEDNELPGNNGLKDQTAALRWVGDNIAQFGGDPSAVTLSGESAGAASVHYHMLSPLSKGLFHRAIAHSGSAYCPWATHASGKLKAATERFISHVGCNLLTTREILDCLRNMPAYVIVEVSRDLHEWQIDPVVIFTPAIEPEGVEDAFLTKDPWTLTSDVPWIAGLNSAEGAFRVELFKSQHIVELNDDFEIIAPVSLFFRDTAVDPVRTALAIKKFYFLDSDIKPNDFEGLTKMYSDSWFIYPVMEAFRRHKGPKYLYYFDYRGANSLVPHYRGASHFDEMQYFHPTNIFFKNFNESTTDDRIMSEKLIDLWTNFIIYGKPTVESSDVVWKESTTATEYLYIGKDELVMDKNLLTERYKFWHTLPYRNKYFPTETIKEVKKDEL